MKPIAILQNVLPDISLEKDNVRYGLQLSAAVLISYLVPWLLHLPEGFWAVMTAMIVMRPRAGATMEEGWARLKGALIGTIAGLLGVWLHTHGVLTSVVTLAVIAVLAFIAGISPALRAGPITALIILSSGGIAGHTAWQVASLRIIEIVIGIVAGLAVSMLTSRLRTRDHFHEEVGNLLKDVGEQTKRALSGKRSSAEEKEAAGLLLKKRLKELVILAASADAEHRMKLSTKREEKAAKKYSRYAKLVTRIVQDVGLFGRIFDAHPELQGSAIWNKAADALPAALSTISPGDAGGGRDPVDALLYCLHPEADASANTERLHRLLEAPISLLAADIRLLRRLERA